MCSPAAISGTQAGLGIGTSLLGYAGQQQAANAQIKYQNQVYSRTAEAARNNVLQQYTQINTGLLQDRAAAQQQALQSTVQEAQAEGRAVASAAEGGVDGNSVHALLDDFARIDATNQLTLSTNLNWTAKQAQEQMKAVRAQGINQMNSAIPQPVQQPSLLGTLLQIGGTGIQSYDSYLQMSRKGPYSYSP